MALNKEKKSNIVKEHGANTSDTGSVEVQVSILSAEIEELTQHLREHVKDTQGRRGLLKKVAQRRRLLKYLKNNDEKRYLALVKKLNIRG